MIKKFTRIGICKRVYTSYTNKKHKSKKINDKSLIINREHEVQASVT